MPCPVGGGDVQGVGRLFWCVWVAEVDKKVEERNIVVRDRRQVAKVVWGKLQHLSNWSPPCQGQGRKVGVFGWVGFGGGGGQMEGALSGQLD